MDGDAPLQQARVRPDDVTGQHGRSRRSASTPPTSVTRKSGASVAKVTIPTALLPPRWKASQLEATRRAAWPMLEHVVPVQKTRLSRKRSDESGLPRRVVMLVSSTRIPRIAPWSVVTRHPSQLAVEPHTATVGTWMDGA
jgi:hypothetical protein